MKVLTAILIWLVLSCSSFAQVQRSALCFDTTMTATGRVLLAGTGSSPFQNPLLFTTARFTYYTAGTPASLSIQIEDGNQSASVQTPVLRLGPNTNTTAADLGFIQIGSRYLWGNLTALSGGTSPSVVLSTCLSVASSAVVGSVSLGGSLPSGTNLLGSVYEIPKTACGNTVASQALGPVPTSSTAVFTANTCVIVIVLINTTASQLTVSVSDNQGTPVNDILNFIIGPNSQLIQPMWGLQFTSGLKWNASTSGVTGGVVGYQ